MRLFKKKQKKENIGNYTWDNIVLGKFIKASKGDLSHVSTNGVINNETISAWFKIQDEYVLTMDSETIEIKKFKKVCFKYATKLREYLLNPKEGSRLNTEVNQLFMEKTKLAKELFSEESVKWDEIIAKTSIGIGGARIIATEITAKEFFNYIKVL